jgi:hypothetical protein
MADPKQPDSLDNLISREKADRENVVLVGGDVDEKTGIRGKLLVVGRPCSTMSEWYRSMGNEEAARECEAEEAARAAEQKQKNGDDTDTGPLPPPPGKKPSPTTTPTIGGARLAVPHRRTPGVRLEPPPPDTSWR